MKILMLANNDPAGTAIKLANAINRTTAHTARLVVRELRYNNRFETDLFLPEMEEDDLDELEGLLKSADIFHFHILMNEDDQIGPFRIRNYIRGKALLNHHHGHPNFRSNPSYFESLYRERNRKTLVSTPDLLKLLPSATWIPNVVPLWDSAFLPVDDEAFFSRRPIWIGQSPTQKALKNTDEFLSVVEALRSTGENRLRQEIIENLPYDLCLKKKRKLHVVFDHMQGYFGVSSIESLAQGKVVIAGLDDWCASHLREFAHGDPLPWTIARNLLELRSVLTELLNSPDLMKERGRYARAFMERHWTEQRIAEMMTTFYSSL